MNSIWNTDFFVVDVETTGSDTRRDKLMEIAAVHVKGGQIVSEYTSLINPRTKIPPFIQKMTGITQSLVKTAPESKNVLEEISNMLDSKGAIFVAHNANFDWHFVNESMKKEGIPFRTMPVLCTLKIARKILPKGQKANLGALAKFFDIRIANRHRALGDAKATALALIEMMRILESEYEVTSKQHLLNFQNRRKKSSAHKNHISKIIKEKQKEIPESPGLIFLLNESSKVIYLTKAFNLKAKYSEFFINNELFSKKLSDIVKKASDIRWQPVKTELHALLEEKKNLQIHKPIFNTYKEVQDSVEDQVMNFLNQKINHLEKEKNMIFVKPESIKGKTFSAFFIKEGELIDYAEIGRKITKENLQKRIMDAYQKDIDDIETFDNFPMLRSYFEKHLDTGKKFLVNGNKEKLTSDVIKFINSVSF